MAQLAVVKAQIHAGGRGKGTILEHPQQHGVQLVRSAEEARQVAQRLLGNRLVTIQTGAEGRDGPSRLSKKAAILPANCTWASSSTAPPLARRDGVERRGRGNRKGGGRDPRTAFSRNTSIPIVGWRHFRSASSAASWSISGRSVRSAQKFMQSLCRVFVDYDCSLAEINPLVVTGAGESAGAGCQDDV